MSKSTNTLLALLLTLPDLEPPLTAEEQEDLKQIACQLSVEPEAWESEIEPELLDLVEANPPWNQLFTTTKTQLDSLGSNIPQGLLPTPEEVEMALSKSDAPGSRGFKPKKEPDSDDDQIHNMAVRILTTPNPCQTSQKVSGFGKLKELLCQPVL